MLKVSYFRTLLKTMPDINQSVHRRHDLVDLLLHFSPSVSSMMQVISGTYVSVWAFVWKYEIFTFNSTPYNALFYFCLSYLLILWTLNKSHCVACSRILPVSVFCVLQGSGVTPLKCVEIYDMDLLQWKKWKSINICQSYERMCSGTIFYWDTVYNVMITKISITIEALFQPKIH